MDAQREAHLKRIVDRFSADVSAKYRKGQAEHGGNLWQKDGLLDCALEEAIDLVIYLSTLREQMDTRSTKSLGPLTCTFCGETRLVEQQQSHRGTRVCCAVCGKDAPLPQPLVRQSIDGDN